MQDLYRLGNFQSRSVSAENFTGEKGAGGMAETGTGAYNARELGKGWKISPFVTITPGKELQLADIRGEGMITHIWIADSSKVQRRLVLRFYWDGEEFPSVEVPLHDFFAAADILSAPVIQSLAVCVNPYRAMNCYWEMPFRKGFRVTVENLASEDINLWYQIDYQLGKIPEDSAYFHAQFRRTNPLPYKEVYTIMDGVTGKGKYVGTYMYWGVNNNGWWGEGEIKFYIDGDTDYPTICGTGTEDYFCGAWDFEINGQYAPYTSPYSGMRMTYRNDLYEANRRFGLYRWHITDPIFFDENLRVTIQALGWRSEGRYLPLQDDISSVAYYYLDRPTDVRGTLPDRNGLEII